MGWISKTIESGNKSEFLKIDNSKRRIEGRFKIFTFEDHGRIVCYNPSLNVSGYGDTFDTAREMMHDIIEDWFLTILDLPPYAQTKELSKYGWKRELYRKKQYHSTVTVSKEGILQNFELPETTEIQEEEIARVMV